jgi:hypothetical protein
MGTVAASVLLPTLLQNSVSKLLQRFCRGGCKPILTGCRHLGEVDLPITRG